jgi:prepilin-type N-terminal cleavage/methylation domain-containing protein
MKTFGSQAGVTLYELMTALSVIAILMSMSAPSYSEFINKRKVAAGANLIATFFENVKMEAVKRNAFATVSFQVADNGTDWCLGAMLGKEVACDCLAEVEECKIDGVTTILSNETFAQFSHLVTTFNTGTISYDPVRGILTNPAGSVAMEVRHSDEDFRVDVSVNAAGNVRKCTPSGYKPVGFATCI